MCSFKKYILFFMLFVTCICNSYSDNYIVSINDIIEGIQFGRKSVCSWHGTIHYEYSLIDTSDYVINDEYFQTLQKAGKTKRVLSFSKNIECYFSQGYWRFDSKLSKGDIPDLSSIIVKKDGEIKKILYRTEENGLITLHGLIYSYDPNEDYYIKEDAEKVLTAPYSFGPYPLELVLQAKIKELSYLAIGNITNENLDEISCIRIHINDNNNSKQYSDIWIAPCFNYAIIKSIFVSENKSDIYLLDYSMIDNLCFLKTYTWLSYKRTSDKFSLHSKTIASLSNDWTINNIISPETFELNFPEGLKIIDRR